MSQVTVQGKGTCRCGCTVTVWSMKDAQSEAPLWLTVPCPICSMPTTIATKGLASEGVRELVPQLVRRGRKPELLGFERKGGSPSPSGEKARGV